MIYENKIKKLMDNIHEHKTENMKLKAEIVALKEDIRQLENQNTFLENYNSRLLYAMKRSKWRISS